LYDDVRTAVGKLGRDILVRIYGIVALNGDGICWTASFR
jgi:hypothetical protein